jgi:YHS domain-containing protein
MRALILLGLAALPFLGCNSSSPTDFWESRGDRVLGIGSDSAEDPVSGASVSKNSAVMIEFRGTTYYFASSDTAATFIRNPEEYALSAGEGEGPRLDRPEVR